MRLKFAIVLLFFTAIVRAQSPQGTWIDVTKDQGGYVFFSEGKNADLLVIEDYEVKETHEICATTTGYFLKSSQSGRYNVNFHGMRTQATFTFSDRYDAEHWAEKFCTPQSLLQITQGKPADLTRKY